MITKEKKKEWIQLLKNDGYKQCYGTYGKASTNERCATGIAYFDMDIRPGRSHGVSLKHWYTIIDLNDKKKYSFKKIARWIQRNVKAK